MHDNKLWKFLKKQWALVWLITTALLLTTIIGYTAYEEANTKMKRVFVANKLVTQLFTSDYLVLGGSHRSVPFDPNDEKNIPFIIRNYNPLDPGKVNEVTYTLTAQLSHKSKTPYTVSELGAGTENVDKWISQNMQIEITDSTDASKKITLSGTTINGSITGISNLNIATRTTHRWNIAYTNIPLDADYCVTLTATPSKGDPISATLGIATMPDTKYESWDCAIADDTDQSIGTYDAFNYVITGSGGYMLKFSYDTTKLEISPTFVAYNKGSEETPDVELKTNSPQTEWNTVEIKVKDTVSRYDIQMYKVNQSNPTWNNLDPDYATASDRWVTFEIIQNAPAANP